MFVYPLLPGADSNLNNFTGSETRLTASQGSDDDEFGYAIDGKGRFLVVGAPNANSGQGATYVRERPTLGGNGSWGETQLDYAPILNTQDRFGASVAIDGTNLIVGAPARHRSPG